MINIREFEEELKDKKYESIYKKIVDRTLELIREIIKVRKICLQIPNNKDEFDFYFIEITFRNEIPYFDNVQKLMKLFNKKSTEYEFEKITEKEICTYIDLYNSIVDELEYYKSQENEINEYGYKKTFEKYTNKLIELFKKMMKYKNKEYNECWSFKEWLDEIDNHFHFYHDDILETIYIVFYGTMYLYDETLDSMEINDVEKIIQLRSLYAILTEEENDYTKYSYYYKDYDLKNGQTYQDLYQEQKQKFIKLFKEMLDYANYSYDKYDLDFELLSALVRDAYPFYFYTLLHLDVMISNPSETYITLLNSMENIYECLPKNYKNREQLLESYQKEEQEFEFIED